MKKLFLSMVAVALIFTACSKDSKELNQEPNQEIDMSDFYVYTDSSDDLSYKSTTSKNSYKTCHSMEVLNRQLNENPGLEKKMYDIEYQTRQFLLARRPKPTSPGGGGSGGGDTDVDVLPIDDGLGTKTIDVIVHVVWNTAAENVSDNDVRAQIDVLNADFNNSNSSQLPSGTTFENDATVTAINFNLLEIRNIQDNSRTQWGTNDAIKAAYPPVNPESVLNIWVCNIGGGILGYAQFPGGNTNTDGVVLLYSSLPGGTAAPYNLGRTATHEVGHYLNLRHIWGDGRCRQDDFVADTPSSDSPNYGCPSFPTVNCKTADMTMNYMDYTNDACMYIFTDGQRNRMRATLVSGGSRSGL